MSTEYLSSVLTDFKQALGVQHATEQATEHSGLRFENDDSFDVLLLAEGVLVVLGVVVSDYQRAIFLENAFLNAYTEKEDALSFQVAADESGRLFIVLFQDIGQINVDRLFELLDLLMGLRTRLLEE